MSNSHKIGELSVGTASDQKMASTVTPKQTEVPQANPAKSVAPPNPLPQTTKNVLVIVRGTKMDAELVKLACSVARPKQMGVVAMYGIEVPRSRKIDEPLSDAEVKTAQEVLDIATSVAERCDYEVEQAIVQSRSFSHSIVEEANLPSCALLVMGVPYQEHRGGKCALDEEIDYVLEHATCRVWLVRGSKESA